MKDLDSYLDDMGDVPAPRNKEREVKRPQKSVKTVKTNPKANPYKGFEPKDIIDCPKCGGTGLFKFMNPIVPDGTCTMCNGSGEVNEIDIRRTDAYWKRVANGDPIDTSYRDHFVAPTEDGLSATHWTKPLARSRSRY